MEGRAGAPRKAKGPRQQKGIQDIRHWFEKGGRPSQITPETREGCGSMEPQKEVKPRMNQLQREGGFIEVLNL